MEVYRQGDVCLIQTERDLDGMPTQQTGLLRKGEHGGMHVLKGLDAKVLRSGNTKYVSAPNGGTVVHGEHHEVSIPPGNYEVRIQREDVGSRAREVAD